MHTLFVRAVLGAVAGALAPRLVQHVQDRLAVRANARIAALAGVNSSAAPTAAAVATSTPSSRQQSPAVLALEQHSNAALPSAASLSTGTNQLASSTASSSQHSPAAQQQHQAPSAMQAAAAAGSSPPSPVPSFSPTAVTFVPGTSSPTSPGSPSSRAAAGMPHQRLKSKLKKAEKIKLDLLLCNSHKATFGCDVSDVHWGSAESSPKPLPAEAEDLLRVLLMQPCFMQASIISRLACSSKAAGMAIDDMCRGYIPVHLKDSITADTAEDFAAWAARHGHLMRTLQVGKGRQGQATAIAAGLQAASSNLCLQQFYSTSEDTSSASLLSFLPPAHLTSLKVHLTPARDTSQVAAAILELTQLRSVMVAALRPLQPKDPVAGASPVLSRLSGLRQLSSLHLQRCMPGDAAASILENLPASLVELRVTQSTGRVAPIELGRLTNLTALQLESARQRHGLLCADELPAQLRIGSFGSCASLQPLEDLMMLRVLTLENPPGDGLSVLKGLMTDGQLTQLRLHYTKPQPTTQVPEPALPVGADSATGWVALAPCLRMLTLTGCELSSPLVHALAQLSRLSRLSLIKCTMTSSIGELSSAVKQLSSLQELEIEGNAKELGSNAVKEPHVTVRSTEIPHCLLRIMAPGVVALKQLLGSIAHISNYAQLRSLRLFLTDTPHVLALSHADNGRPGDCLAPWLAHVAEATQLTRLALGQDLMHAAGDKCFSRLAPKLTHMQDLRLQLGSNVKSDLTLQAISTYMPKLTCLDIPDGRLFELGEALKPLASLKQLRVLGLDDTSCISSEAAAALRKKLGLPGPLSTKDARHWRQQPDEGW